MNCKIDGAYPAFLDKYGFQQSHFGAIGSALDTRIMIPHCSFDSRHEFVEVGWFEIPSHLPKAPTTLPTITATSLSQVFSGFSPFAFTLTVPVGAWLPLITHSLIASLTLFLLLLNVLTLTPPLLTISMTFVLRPPANVRQKYDTSDPVSRLERSGCKKLAGGWIKSGSMGCGGGVMDERSDSKARIF